ncbi:MULTISPECIES: glutamate--cysteine ligase [Cyanobium]|uniref:Putative glutamate--cysteine ligase n=1 Tax=Cyanobium usitatum str. Tous TaxID=2116684 RepID=A0A2P7MU69_9CYAN|nr:MULTISPECIES: glutamate--cysteine ligase [Cyanobium]MCP9780782.1 glutamate--cysteine ligase [Cyanobium sp. To12R1]PSJ04798.1 putative glutamate--cysteine ligase [Cyanobium usitatum str. Tous]
MSAPLLLKGFEVELYTGRADGTVVGCSAEAAAALEGFVTEPDCRNLEYITPPDADYARQLQLLLEPRQRLRRWLASRQLTLLPGSTLSLGDSQRFERSDPANPYHGYIEATYGTKVVTASVHINLGLTAGHGLEPMTSLFAGLRLMRCEASLLLALSASSPFLDGVVTAAHSQRWLQFPLTPAEVPLFLDHQHYIDWMGEQLALGTMQNVRHLWTSVRPNGDNRPHDLNRLEIRICDLVTDPLVLLAITAFAELRLQKLMREPERYDPLQASRLDPSQLAALADANDRAAARSSLDATLMHWRNGAPIQARDWLAQELADLAPLAQELGLTRVLAPLQGVLGQGNQAMSWLAGHQAGLSIPTLLNQTVEAMASQEAELLEAIATDGGPGPLG